MTYFHDNGAESLDGVTPRRRPARRRPARRTPAAKVPSFLKKPRIKANAADLVKAKNILANAKLPPKPASVESQEIVKSLVRKAATRKAPAAAKLLKKAALVSPSLAKKEITKKVKTGPESQRKKIAHAVMHANIEFFGLEGAHNGLGFVDALMQAAADVGAQLGPHVVDAAGKATAGLVDQAGKNISKMIDDTAKGFRFPGAPAARRPAPKKTSSRKKQRRVKRKTQVASAKESARKAALAMRSPFAQQKATPIMQTRLPAAAPAAPTAAACFPASAKVLTPRGYREIGSLREGDSVVSGKMRVETITKKLSYAPSEVFCVMLEGRAAPVRTTRHHTFLTKRGWLKADQMRVGDEMIGPNAGRVSGFAVQAAEAVYNLHTTGDHTFVVEGVVAHNFTEFRELRTAWHQMFVDGRKAVFA